MLLLKIAVDVVEVLNLLYNTYQSNHINDPLINCDMT